jgi:hypothetical protein
MEEHGLNLLGNVVLRKIFRPKGEDVTGSTKNGVLVFYDLTSTPSII